MVGHYLLPKIRGDDGRRWRRSWDRLFRGISGQRQKQKPSRGSAKKTEENCFYIVHSSNSISLRTFLTFSTRMAKPTFCAPDTMAELIPITSPRRFSKGPPELPGFIAVSVCITFSRRSDISPELAVTERDSPEIIPFDTELENWPRALPMATTVCPISKPSESPNTTVANPTASIFTTARSWKGSRAKTLASYLVSSFVMTVYDASASRTTCLFVTIKPSLLTINPVPAPTCLLSVPFCLNSGWLLRRPGSARVPLREQSKN